MYGKSTEGSASMRESNNGSGGHEPCYVIQPNIRRA